MDELREVAGTFDCERRRPLAEIAADFPQVDVSGCSPVDELWVEDRYRATAEARDRAVQALDAIAARPEQVVAVVSHGATMGGAWRCTLCHSFRSRTKLIRPRVAVLFAGAESYGVAKHPRVACELDPPRKNCEVVATTLTKDRVTGLLTLSGYSGPEAAAKL